MYIPEINRSKNIHHSKLQSTCSNAHPNHLRETLLLLTSVSIFLSNRPVFLICPNPSVVGLSRARASQ